MTVLRHRSTVALAATALAAGFAGAAFGPWSPHPTRGFWGGLRLIEHTSDALAVTSPADLQAAADLAVVGVVVDVVEGPHGIPILDHDGQRIGVLPSPDWYPTRSRLVIEIREVLAGTTDGPQAGDRVIVDTPAAEVQSAPPSEPAALFLRRETGWAGTRWDGAYTSVHALGIVTEGSGDLFTPLEPEPDIIDTVTSAHNLEELEAELG